MFACSLPTFAITNLNVTSFWKLGYYCGFNATGATKPPPELLRPGRLAPRNDLSLWSQCFLWYANTWWSRATGGSKGLMLYKMGGVDDKGLLKRWLDDYDKEHGCKAFQVTPVTLPLSDMDTCLEFYSNNRRWASSNESLWFMKESNGSQGTHINLWTSSQVHAKWQAQGEKGASGSRTRGLGVQMHLKTTIAALPSEDGHRRDVAEEVVHAGEDRAKWASAERLCPDNGSVASLAVPDTWLIDGYKFDNRVYVLVPSLVSLVIATHKCPLLTRYFTRVCPRLPHVSSANKPCIPCTCRVHPGRVRGNGMNALEG